MPVFQTGRGVRQDRPNQPFRVYTGSGVICLETEDAGCCDIVRWWTRRLMAFLGARWLTSPPFGVCSLGGCCPV